MFLTFIETIILEKNDSPHVSAVLEDVKRVKVNEPKEGRLYPSLSDIETANETETERAKSSCDNRCDTSTSIIDWILFLLCLA